MREATATVDVVQGRLLAWAAWLTGGSSAAGYPTKNVLHESWLPPTPGQTPTMRTDGGGGSLQERDLHRIIGSALSVRLQNTLVVVYLMRAKPDEQVMRLDCQPSTVRARIGEAKAIIGKCLDL